MKRPESKLILAALGGTMLGALAMLLVVDRVSLTPPDSQPAAGTTRSEERSEVSLPAADARRFGEIMTQVRREYVDQISNERLVEQAMRGMISGLDPYSAYLDQREYEELRRGAAGSYPGIGIEVTAENGGIKVVRSLVDSPAARAGIRGGDLILRIDDEPVGANVVAALDQMRGPAGSLVRLTLRRAETAELVNVALERAKVDVTSVTGEWLEPAYGYVRIASFSDNTRGDFERVLQQFAATPPRLRGLVLDVRHNPGGVLEAAVAVADTLLEQGNIVSAVGRAPTAQFRMDATSGQLLSGVDIALLVNGSSASAAEILAGALKDNARAVLIGRRTYGKGVVQSVIPLSDGRALKLTTSRYTTPAGFAIDETGIEPDILIPGPDIVPQEARVDPEIRLALRELQQRGSSEKRPAGSEQTTQQ